MITGVGKVVLYVEDQQIARQFWTEVMDFELAQDTEYGEERWLEVRAPNGVVLVLSKRPAEQDLRHEEVPDQLPHSNAFFECDDVTRTHEELSARGVTFPQPPIEYPWGWWAMFEDPDGTRYALRPADPG
jgi:predicted enzyme related to lactoylglutathione lyase